MVLVPEEFMNMLERKENMQTAPMTKSMIRLDQKMDNILEDTKKPADDKATQYTQNLQRFLDVQEQKRDFIPTVKIHQESSSPLITNAQEIKKEEVMKSEESPSEAKSPLSENEILESIPKNSRTLAKSMITRLKANREHVTWNNKGEVSVNGQPVTGSNIIDLVNDQLRARKDFNPKGWEQFTESLEKINMPKYLMRNEKRKSHITQLHKQVTPESTQGAENYAFPPTPPTTPRTSKIPTLRRAAKVKRFSDNWITY